MTASIHEDDADFEACMPLRRRVEKKVEGITGARAAGWAMCEPGAQGAL